MNSAFADFFFLISLSVFEFFNYSGLIACRKTSLRRCNSSETCYAQRRSKVKIGEVTGQSVDLMLTVTYYVFVVISDA